MLSLKILWNLHAAYPTSCQQFENLSVSLLFQTVFFRCFDLPFYPPVTGWSKNPVYVCSWFHSYFRFPWNIQETFYEKEQKILFHEKNLSTQFLHFELTIKILPVLPPPDKICSVCVVTFIILHFVVRNIKNLKTCGFCIRICLIPFIIRFPKKIQKNIRFFHYTVYRRS